MTGDEVRDARARLGASWGFGRPLFQSELGRALRLKAKHPGETVREWEERGTITGPAAVAILMMLAGARPPDPLAAIRRQERF